MPSFMDKKLRAEYSDLPERERNHAIYGTENKMGMMHGSAITEKGREAEHEHEMTHSDGHSFMHGPMHEHSMHPMMHHGMHEDMHPDDMDGEMGDGMDEHDAEPIERESFAGHRPMMRPKRSFMRGW